MSIEETPNSVFQKLDVHRRESGRQQSWPAQMELFHEMDHSHISLPSPIEV